MELSRLGQLPHHLPSYFDLLNAFHDPGFLRLRGEEVVFYSGRIPALSSLEAPVRLPPRLVPIDTYAYFPEEDLVSEAELDPETGVVEEEEKLESSGRGPSEVFDEQPLFLYFPEFHAISVKQVSKGSGKLPHPLLRDVSHLNWKAVALPYVLEFLRGATSQEVRNIYFIDNEVHYLERLQSSFDGMKKFGAVKGEFIAIHLPYDYSAQKRAAKEAILLKGCPVSLR